MKTAFSTLSCPNWSLKQIVINAKAFDYDGIDFRGYLNCIDITKAPIFSKTNIYETISILKDNNLAVSCLGTDAKMFNNTPAELENSLNQIREYASLAQALGSGQLRIFGGVIKNNVSKENAIQVAAETLLKINEIGREYSLLMAIETHDDWADTTLLKKAFEQCGLTSNLGVIWDIHHTVWQAKESIGNTYKNIKDFIVNTHWKDSATEKDAPVPLGTGNIPLREAFQTLQTNSYSGWYTLEVEKRWQTEAAEPEETLPAFKRFLKTLNKQS